MDIYEWIGLGGKRYIENCTMKLDCEGKAKGSEGNLIGYGYVECPSLYRVWEKGRT